MQRSQKEKDSRGTANFAINNLQELGKYQIGHVYMVDATHKLTKLFLNCSAMSHMFCERTFFTSYSIATPHETVSVRDARNIPVIG